MNKAWVGTFHPHVMNKLDAKGVAKHRVGRKDSPYKVVDSLAVGDIVAVYTSVDTFGHAYWLARVVPYDESGAVSYIVPKGKEVSCPISEEEYHWRGGACGEGCIL